MSAAECRLLVFGDDAATGPGSVDEGACRRTLSLTSHGVVRACAASRRYRPSGLEDGAAVRVGVSPSWTVRPRRVPRMFHVEHRRWSVATEASSWCSGRCAIGMGISRPWAVISAEVSRMVSRGTSWVCRQQEVSTIWGWRMMQWASPGCRRPRTSEADDWVLCSTWNVWCRRASDCPGGGDRQLPWRRTRMREKAAPGSCRVLCALIAEGRTCK